MFQTLLILLVITALTAGVELFPKHLPDRWAQLLIRTAFIVYLAGNLYFTLFSRIIGTGTYVDLRPFGSFLRLSETIDANFDNASGFAALFLKDASIYTSVVLNILLYYPMGFLLTVMFPKLKGWQIIFIGFAASVATEFTQYLFRMGWCETDDVITNTLGTAFGAYIRWLQVKASPLRK